MKKILKKLNMFLGNPRQITDNRFSIINGIEDFTDYSDFILSHPAEFVGEYEISRQRGNYDISECIAKIIVAEVYYQADDCYNALILTNSALAFLEKKDNVEIWVVARFIQLCIMIVTGQLKAIFPLVDSMKEDVIHSENKQLIANYEALVVWCALYDDDWNIIDEWMENRAPNEFGKIEFADSLACFVKARVYYFQGRYYALITLLQSLEKVLKEKQRVMQLCELYMLMAMALYADNRKEEAFGYLEMIIDDCAERGFVRLLADEGEPMYRMINEYLEKGSSIDEKQIKYLKSVRKAAKNVALEFPHYLKDHRSETVSLTKKEQEILSLLASNRTNIEMAEFLGCSVNTIKYHMKNIFRKLGVNNRKDAVAATKKYR